MSTNRLEGGLRVGNMAEFDLMMVMTNFRCEPTKWLVDGRQCAVWICGDQPSAFDPIGHWRCMGYC